MAGRGVVHGTTSTHSVRTYTISNGRRIGLVCKVEGTVVGGNKWWYLVASNDDTSWVSARYVRNIGAAPDHCDPSDGLLLGTTTTRVNVREGASSADRVTSVAAKGARIRFQCYTQTSRTHRWLLTAGGRWISGDYVNESTKLRYCA